MNYTASLNEEEKECTSTQLILHKHLIVWPIKSLFLVVLVLAAASVVAQYWCGLSKTVAVS